MPDLETEVTQTQVENQDIPGNKEDDKVPAWQSAVYEARQREIAKNEEIARLQAELDKRTPPVKEEVTLEQGDTFNNPEKFRQVIQNDLNRAVAPLNDFVAQTKRQQDYQNLKAQFIQAQPAIRQIEHLIDQEYRSNPNLSVDSNTLFATIERVVGRIAMSGGFNNNTQQTPKQDTNVIPPNNIPPSRSAPTPAKAKINEADFTENDRRLARENGMSLEEYSIMRDCPPHEAAAKWDEIRKARKAAKGGK